MHPGPGPSAAGAWQSPLPAVFCHPPSSCWRILNLGRPVGGGTLVYVMLVGGRTVTWTQICWFKSGALPLSTGPHSSYRGQNQCSLASAGLTHSLASPPRPP